MIIKLKKINQFSMTLNKSIIKVSERNKYLLDNNKFDFIIHCSCNLNLKFIRVFVLIKNFFNKNNKECDLT